MFFTCRIGCRYFGIPDFLMTSFFLKKKKKIQLSSKKKTDYTDGPSPVALTENHYRIVRHRSSACLTHPFIYRICLTAITSDYLIRIACTLHVNNLPATQP